MNLQCEPSDEGEVRNPNRWFHFYALCLVALSVAPALLGFLEIYIKKGKQLRFYCLRCVSLKVCILTYENVTRF